MKFLPLFLLASALLVGCAARPLKPGWSGIKSASGFVGAVQQSENPKADSTQKYERLPDGTERVETKIGASQKDTAREIGAKLASLRPVMYVGIVIFLFGAASLFWPPLKLLVGSTTTSLVAIAAGISLIVLPSLVAGNEILILAVALGALGLYWFSHRHGKARGELESMKR